MKNNKNGFNTKCLTCQNSHCRKSILGKLFCFCNRTKNFIKVIGVFLIAVAAPITINILYMIGSEKQNTVFEGSHLLAYAGACIFGLAVYWQTRKIHKKNQELQESLLRIEDYNLQYNTFAYLNILRIETTADFCPLKTFKLEKAIPWPLDARATPLGYPNGIPDNFPKRWKRQLKKELRPFPLGNTPDYREEIIEEKVFIRYKEEFSDGANNISSTSTLSVDPYEGIYYAGNSSELVLWPKTLARPRDNPYYTSFSINFFAKSSRDDFFVKEIEIHALELTLKSKNKNQYLFGDRLHCFAEIIRQPLRLKATAIAENSYYSTKYNCNHAFSIKLHLCHFYADMLEITGFNEMDINIDAVYIRTCSHRKNVV